MIGLIVGHPPIVAILEVDCSAEDGPIPRHHFIQTGRLEGDMMQPGFDDTHCGLPKLLHRGVCGSACSSSRIYQRVKRPSAKVSVYQGTSFSICLYCACVSSGSFRTKAMTFHISASLSDSP